MSEPRPAIAVAIVGAGLMGGWHARAAERCGARIVAVCDPDAAAARALAARHRARNEPDPERLFASTPVDVAHLCSPPPSHRDLAVRALEAGAHVIVEKPFAANPDDADEILELAARRGRIAIPVHQFLFQGWTEQIPAIREIVHLRFSACSAGADSVDDPDRIVDEILPHPLALFERCCPGAIAAAHWQVIRARAGELIAQADLGNTTCAIEISLSARPTRNEFAIHGRDGSLHADLFHGFAIREGPHRSRVYKLARPLLLGSRRFAAAGANGLARFGRRETAYPGLRALIAACYRHVLGTGPPPLSADHVRSVERARAQIVAARPTGR